MKLDDNNESKESSISILPILLISLLGAIIFGIIVYIAYRFRIKKLTNKSKLNNRALKYIDNSIEKIISKDQSNKSYNISMNKTKINFNKNRKIIKPEIIKNKSKKDSQEDYKKNKIVIFSTKFESKINLSNKNKKYYYENSNLKIPKISDNNVNKDLTNVDRVNIRSNLKYNTMEKKYDNEQNCKQDLINISI